MAYVSDRCVYALQSLSTNIRYMLQNNKTNIRNTGAEHRHPLTGPDWLEYSSSMRESTTRREQDMTRFRKALWERHCLTSRVLIQEVSEEQQPGTRRLRAAAPSPVKARSLVGGATIAGSSNPSDIIRCTTATLVYFSIHGACATRRRAV